MVKAGLGVGTGVEVEADGAVLALLEAPESGLPVIALPVWYVMVEVRQDAHADGALVGETAVEVVVLQAEVSQVVGLIYVAGLVRGIATTMIALDEHTHLRRLVVNVVPPSILQQRPRQVRDLIAQIRRHDVLGVQAGLPVLGHDANGAVVLQLSPSSAVALCVVADKLPHARCLYICCGVALWTRDLRDYLFLREVREVEHVLAGDDVSCGIGFQKLRVETKDVDELVENRQTRFRCAIVVVGREIQHRYRRSRVEAVVLANATDRDVFGGLECHQQQDIDVVRAVAGKEVLCVDVAKQVSVCVTAEPH
eukprot:PhM_4_TR382/c0_g1_i1/m.81345